jgi:hypothetical protein
MARQAETNEQSPQISGGIFSRKNGRITRPGKPPEFATWLDDAAGLLQNVQKTLTETMDGVRGNFDISSQSPKQPTMRG